LESKVDLKWCMQLEVHLYIYCNSNTGEGYSNLTRVV
jgi:hypothetical protein